METIGELLERLSHLSYLQASGFALIAILTLDLLLTLVHSIQELNGHLWRYFGAIAGLQIPDAIGFSLFFLVLTATLWALGLAGIAGYVPIFGRVSDNLAMAALGGLIGSRLSDMRYSHVRLDRQGYRPNPGLSSTPYYLAEAVILAVLFLPGLLIHWWSAPTGFLIGWLFFYSILPFLRFLRRVIPSLSQDAWNPKEPIPLRAQ
jgi:hypothetical protein